MMEASKESKPRQLEIELDERTSSGEYANFVIVTHSPAEFVMDFTQIMPGMPKAKVRARIIMAPVHAKSFALALLENVKKYEARFGEINTPQEDWLKEYGVKLPVDSLPN